jgi:hypothetical protein
MENRAADILHARKAPFLYAFRRSVKFRQLSFPMTLSLNFPPHEPLPARGGDFRRWNPFS